MSATFLSAQRRRRLLPLMGVVALAVAGCTAGTDHDESASPVASSSTSAGGAPSPSSTDTPGEGEPSTSAGSGGETTAASSVCNTDQLEASLGPGAGGGAGHQYPTLVLTNTGTTSCTMGGYPGVSFVGGNSGTQLGDAAARDTTVAATTLTMEPGASVHADLDITQAANYPEDTCGPTPATGLRVYPPDQTAALFVASDDFTACANAGTTLITVRPVQAGSE